MSFYRRWYSQTECYGEASYNFSISQELVKTDLDVGWGMLGVRTSPTLDKYEEYIVGWTTIPDSLTFFGLEPPIIYRHMSSQGCIMNWRYLVPRILGNHKSYLGMPGKNLSFRRMVSSCRLLLLSCEISLLSLPFDIGKWILPVDELNMSRDK